MISIQGKGVSTGVAVGPLYFYRRAKSEITRAAVADTEAEWARFKAAQEKAIAELNALAEKARAEAGDEAAKYNHYREFVEACLAGDLEKCGSKLSYAAPLTEALLIGCIALRFPGEELAFDAKTMRFTNKPEANMFLKAPKRGEWDFARLAVR